MKCLERLQTDYVDCFMNHMAPNVEQVTHEAFHAAAEELKAEGKVRFLGLSNHGIEHSFAGPTTDTMESVVLKAVEDGRFDVFLFVYNFLQKEQGEKILKACREKNLGTTLMKANPVKAYLEGKEIYDRYQKKGLKLPEWFTNSVKDYEIRIKKAEELYPTYMLEMMDRKAQQYIHLMTYPIILRS